MKEPKHGIPSIILLTTFEATARLGSMARAAEELQISSPAVSRYIRNLETSLDVKLFERKGRGITLSERGRDYFVAVQSSIQSLRAAGHKLRTGKTTLTIGCAQEMSVLFLQPIYSQLKQCLGEDIEIRMLNCDNDMLPLLLSSGMDITFEQSVGRTDDYSARILDEEIVPVASPAFIKRFRRELAGHPDSWLGVPRLGSDPRGSGWATWGIWFDSQRCQPPDAPTQIFENYFYLLEAAANGEGLAIGWNGYVKSYFETGRLIPVRDEWFKTETGNYAVLTTSGRQRPIARRFLEALPKLATDLMDGNEALKSSRKRWAREGFTG